MKLYYTLGPASLELHTELQAAGGEGVRLCFSFGTPDVHLERARAIKAINPACLTIVDLEGGGARIGDINTDDERLSVVAGQAIQLVQADAVREQSLPIPDADFYASLSDGAELIIGDGDVILTVEERDGFFFGVSDQDGFIEGNRGVVISGGTYTPACLTEKDLAAIDHIVQHDEYDAIALSFVASAADIEQVRDRCVAAGVEKQIIAKVETQAGVDNITAICAAADQVMVARGDMALYLPWTQMPAAVDTVVAACTTHNTPFIIATQVATSLVAGRMMTRAEMTDLWHWKQAGADAVLLSRETAWGEDPVHAVQTVAQLLAVE